MLALATSIKIQAKIGEQLHVFWDVVFGCILEGFGGGFEQAKSSIFVLFSSFFHCKIEIEKMTKKLRPLQAGGFGWEADPLSRNPHPVGVLATFY